MKAISKYLQQSAEPEVEALHHWPAEARFSHVVVIPAFDETPDFFYRLVSEQLAQNNALAIIVINRPDSVAECPRNQQLLHTIETSLAPLWPHKYGPFSNCQLLGRNAFGVLLVDRDRLPIPHDQGVGLARKIGSDLAAGLIAAGKITSPWIHSTDADAHLPEHYFESVKRLEPHCSAACYRFNHIDEGGTIGAATQWYQRSLIHYRDGLERAGSPYAYFTIGSTLVFSYTAYCQARGFPKRSGGEDFYLLNKLAKLGQIDTMAEIIELEARISHRVPFGTGPATEKVVQRLDSGDPLLSYHPEIFTQLGHWLTLARETIENSPNQLLPLDLSPLHRDSQQALKTLGIDRCWQHLGQTSNSAWRMRHFHHWFDAFRTLKFVHHLQQHAFAPQPLTD